MIKRRNLIYYSLLFVAGCTVTTNNPNFRREDSAVQMPEKLRFAVTDVKGLDKLQQDYEPFRATLEEVLATKIEFFGVDNYFEAASALQVAKLDIAWAGPSEYVVIRARTNAVPLVTISRAGYYTIIAVARDSGIKSLADLKGKTVDMWKLGSNGAHIGTVKLLVDAGLDPQLDFKTVLSGNDSIEGLKNGEIDAWGRPVHKYKPALKQAGASESDYPLIAQGPLLPGDILVVSSHLDPDLVAEIRTRILSNQEKLLASIVSVKALAKFKNAKMIAAQDSDYDMIREVYQAMGQGNFIQGK
ncbi:MAG: PhnD/SsuA/transferrin family substrate-binding protein [Hormoscilla sp.]